MQNKDIIRVAFGTILMLMIPLVLTLLGSGVDREGWNWGRGDFIIMGILLFSTGLVVKLIAKKLSISVHKRVISIIATIVVFLFVWVELAVGILGLF